MAKARAVNLDGKPNGNADGIGTNQGSDNNIAGNGTDGISSGTGPIDPATAAASAGAPTGSDTGSGSTRGRGRPAGSKNKQTTGKTSPLDLSISDSLLFSVHFMLAERTGIQQIKLTEQESLLLATKLSAVQSFYNVNISPKTKAVIELSIAAATIYGPRVASYVIEQREAAKAPRIHLKERNTEHGASTLPH